eukprot:2041986-Rhodomonas_salina.2
MRVLKFICGGVRWRSGRRAVSGKSRWSASESDAVRAVGRWGPWRIWSVNAQAAPRVSARVQGTRSVRACWSHVLRAACKY